MLANQDTVIFGDSILLVPYRPEHVARYHEWMQSEELQELTASEPLALDQEYEMQEKWRIDEDKLTFIIHARPEAADPNTLAAANALAAPMIGDVNLFLKGSPAEEDFEVEVEIMIAEPSYRRKGAASAALQLLLSYATLARSELAHASTALVSPLPLPREALVVRIGADNAPSTALFKKLGFVVTRHVPVFNEIEMRLAPGENGQGWRAGEVKGVVFA